MRLHAISRRSGIPGLVLAASLLGGGGPPARADVKLPAIIGPHMVLQRGQEDRLWGWADPGERVTVKVADQTKRARADDDGKWTVTLDPLEAGGPYTLTFVGKNTITIGDVLVGEVWLCSGQSNMEWPVASANDADLEIRTANYPEIRLISVPKVGTQEPKDDFEGEWKVCSPETVGDFSAVGYLFGRRLHQALGVPVGLIDDSWGGSACEAWIRRDLLEDDPKYRSLMDRWDQIESNVSKAQGEYEKKLADWKEAAAKARAEGKQPPRQPQSPDAVLRGNARPGNIYNGVLKPTIGYGIRGAIWYQGETNASRAYQYRDLFPLMIQSWRDEWGIGDFPFYWVQLADFRPEKPEPADSDWAELREAQTMTMAKLPNTGQAVIIDLGEAQDIHPRNKQDVANRLARWPLARRIRPRHPVPEPDVPIDGDEGEQGRPHVRPRRGRPQGVRRPRAPRLHDRGERPEVRPRLREGRRQGPGRGLVRSGLRPGRRPLRLGRQPRLQPLQQGGAPRLPLPDRRLARRDRRGPVGGLTLGSRQRNS